MKNLLYIFISCFLLSSCFNSGEVAREQEYKKSTKNFTIKERLSLPDKLEEISGLEKYGNTFLGFNDSGGAPEVYQFTNSNPSEIIKTIKIKNAKNTDWEEIAMSDSLIFVGDFGNNRGNRKDLKIYYFPKKVLENNKDFVEAEADTITFFYPEQEDYTLKTHKHNFDLEAMFYYGGKLHLFTKQWKSLKTSHYTVDIIKGKQPAWLVEEFTTDFLITGADAKLINNELNVAFVGYTKRGTVYLLKGVVSPDIPQSKWLTDGEFTRYKIGFAGDVGQVEGVTIISENEICYSAERFKRMTFNYPQNVTCIEFK
ncbi:hypothetical protein KRX57_04235 [Weeksellaceae bacterium TAE3-ERU29]|nr:hypothetical protein [Weeksellaceae bacterium TAE3-ERU29]